MEFNWIHKPVRKSNSTHESLKRVIGDDWMCGDSAIGRSPSTEQRLKSTELYAVGLRKSSYYLTSSFLLYGCCSCGVLQRVQYQGEFRYIPSHGHDDIMQQQIM